MPRTLVTVLTVLLACESNSLCAPPKIPGATSKVVWETNGAPFDVATALKLPIAERNAAPLYLDALFEFSGELVSCFEQTPENLARMTEVRERIKQYVEITNTLEKDPKSVNPEVIDQLVAGYAVGFKKLRAAQERPECVFEAGLSFTSLLPHAQSVRQVARVITLKSQRDLARGHVDAVLDDIEVALRLNNDVRRRGYIISHLVSIAVESILCRDVVPRVLASKHCTIKDCDRLLKILRAYRPDSAEQFLASMQIEYLSIRTFFYDIQHQVGDFDLKKKDKDGKAVKLEDVFVKMIGVSNSTAKDTLKQLKSLTEKDYRNEVNWLDLTYFRAKQTRFLSYTERQQRLEEITNEAVKNTILLRHVLAAYPQAMKAFVRSEAYLNGTECLIALKRWQLNHPNTKSASLRAVMVESGASQIPQDPYANRKPMRINWKLKSPVVFSIGPDSQSQNGATDWKFGFQPGDILFPLKGTSD